MAAKNIRKKAGMGELGLRADVVIGELYNPW